MMNVDLVTSNFTIVASPLPCCEHWFLLRRTFLTRLIVGKRIRFGSYQNKIYESFAYLAGNDDRFVLFLRRPEESSHLQLLIKFLTALKLADRLSNRYTSNASLFSRGFVSIFMKIIAILGLRICYST